MRPGYRDLDCVGWCEQVLHYQRVPRETPSYDDLAKRVDSLDSVHDLGGNRIFYLALPPSVFSSALGALDALWPSRQ